MKPPASASFLCRPGSPSGPPAAGCAPVDDVVSTGEAAKMLGVSSANTVKNWLEGGHFPGAFRTVGGHWRFPRAEVLAMRRYMEELRAKNSRGDMMPPDLNDDVEPPLL